MLKKIVKYGNSNAIVLDKALLELLNMAEGSIVKIKTDGISLIITPQIPLVEETVSPTLTVENIFNDIKKKAMELSFGSPEKVQAYETACKEIIERYAAITRTKKESIPELRKALEVNEKRFAQDKANPEYAEQIRKVHQKYIPELECMYQELDKLIEEHCLQGVNTANMDGATSAFAKVHEKYSHLSPALVALNENAEYVHEMVLLAEKYQINNNATPSAEYCEEYTKLISKYIPEYAAYGQEVKKIAEQFYQPPLENKKVSESVKSKKSRKTV